MCACMCIDHTQQHAICTGFTIVPLAILSDNYCYVVVDDASKTAVAIDPADPEAVKASQCTATVQPLPQYVILQRCIQEKNLSLKALLTTHKHWYSNLLLNEVECFRQNCKGGGQKWDNSI